MVSFPGREYYGLTTGCSGWTEILSWLVAKDRCDHLLKTVQSLDQCDCLLKAVWSEWCNDIQAARTGGKLFEHSVIGSGC